MACERRRSRLLAWSIELIERELVMRRQSSPEFCVFTGLTARATGAQHRSMSKLASPAMILLTVLRWPILAVAQLQVITVPKNPLDTGSKGNKLQPGSPGSDA